MTNFEWHTDDRSSWDDDPVANTNPSRRISNRILFSLLFFALLLLAGNLLYSRLEKTVTQSVDATENELRATWQLLNEKAIAGDMDIFSSLLSGNDSDWAYGYQSMVGNGGLLNRDAFDLTYSAVPVDQSNIVVSPALNSAEINSVVSYTFKIGNGMTQDIQLRQAQVFRKGSTRWLLAPPDSQWWGDTQEAQAVWGNYTYPARDAVIVQRLMTDINLAWSSLCASTDAGYCAADTPTVAFSIEPQSFSQLDLLPAMNGAGTHLPLPTPSLVGLPTDDASYRALRAGYGRLILRRLLTDGLSTAENCCQDQQLFIDALTEHILVDQGFVASAISAEQYRIALEQVTTVSFLNTAPQSGGYGKLQLTAAYVWLVYFHQQYPSTPYGEMVTRLAIYQDPVQWMQVNASRDDSNAPFTDTGTWLTTHFGGYRDWLESQFKQAAQ